MAKLKRLVTPKSGMELAFEKEKEACEALGLSTEHLEEVVDEIEEKDPEAYKTLLAELVTKYFSNKTEFDSYKKLVDNDNKAIKEIMIENSLEEFEQGNIVAKCSISTRETFNEDTLLAIVKKARIKGLVKKKDYVDTDALEAAIYNGTFDAAKLEPAREFKEVVTLKVSKKKEKKNAK